MSPERMKRAAEILREEAEAWRRSGAPSGEWLDTYSSQASKARHDEYLALVSELEQHAQTPPS